MDIWITGIGSICSAGAGSNALFNATLASSISTRTIKVSSGKEKSNLPVCSIDDSSFDLPRFNEINKLDRSSKLAIVAGKEAWEQSGLNASQIEPDRISVIVGTSRGPVGKWEETYQRQLSGKKQLPSLAATGTMAALSGSLSQFLGVTGTSLTLSSTCSSGASAIGTGASLILGGSCDVSVVGGSESVINEAIISVMKSAGLLGNDPVPDKTCKPFDIGRNGLVVGEGSGFLILEASEHVMKRGGVPLARLSGWASSLSQSGKVGVEESGSGLARTIKNTISMAEIEPSDISYINAHGTGTILNDLCESKAFNQVVGLSDVPVSSIKPITGHCLGASPALEAVLSVMSLKEGSIPHTANLENIDPQINLNLIKGQPQKLNQNHVLSTSLGFWGNHASLLFSSVS
jgi:3-oxoacyl-[acyl-carrier-protein] synthase II